MKIAIASKIILMLSVIAFYSNWDNDYFLMPYRAGDKWGLCDTLGVVKVQPVYDGFVDMIVDEQSKKSFYYVKQNGRTIVIDHNNVQHLKGYDSINPVTLHMYKGRKMGMYMYKHGNSHSGTTGGFVVLAEPIYDDIERIEHWVYRLKVKGKQGLLYLDYDTFSIPLKPEYDKIVFEKPYFKGYKGSTAAGSFKDPIYNYGEDIAPDPGRDKERIKKEQQRKEAEERKRLIENLKRDASAEDLINITPFEITPLNKYVKYREGEKQGYASFYYALEGNTKKLIKKMVMPAIYDSISEAGRSRFLVKQDGKYGFYSSGKMVVEPLYDDIKFQSKYADEILLKKGKKYAIYHFNRAKILTDFEFDDYTFLPKSEFLYFTILNKGKKEVLWENAKPSEEYDKLIAGYDISTKNDKPRYFTHFKCKKNGKWGLLSNGEIWVPALFDDVITEHVEFYTTIENEKKGAYLEMGDVSINIPPRYKSIEMFKILVINHKSYYLFRVVNTEGILFYTDRHGKEFNQS